MDDLNQQNESLVGWMARHNDKIIGFFDRQDDAVNGLNGYQMENQVAIGDSLEVLKIDLTNDGL